MDHEKILSVKDLEIKFGLRGKTLNAIRGVSLDLYKGEILAIVGESGSGKSVFTKSFIGLLDANGFISNGEIRYFGCDDGKMVDLAKLKKEREWLKIRGHEVAMIMQDPMTSLNPLKTIGEQIVEAVRLHQHLKGAAAKAKAIEYLTDVGITYPEQRFGQYPHEFSGGMRQRVVIAIAIACNPQILICDEPTTALDVTIQAQILKLMNELKKEKGTAIMFITHDLGVINQMADDVAVLYCGQVVEMAPVDIIFDGTSAYQHPYTEGLMNSIPRLDTPVNTRLAVIPGSVPHPLNLPKGCKFCTRCPYADERCRTEEPAYREIESGHQIRCHYPRKEVRHE